MIINGTLEDIDLAQVILKEINGLDKERAGLSNEEIAKEIKTKLSETNFVVSSSIILQSHSCVKY